MSGDESSAGEVVLPCADLDATLAFLTGELGLVLDAIEPADDPEVAVVRGLGLRLRLERGADGPPVTLRVARAGLTAPRELVAPNGTRVLLVPRDGALAVPPLAPALVVARAADGAPWVRGRAGMEYRDLLPGRQGGRFAAARIRIAAGGPVPDLVHHHRVRLQLLHCRRGWVRVVYEDQGPPFELAAGDGVLQPPGIRHRVLAASPGLEVVELSCPARHATLADHALALPTPRADPQRAWAGQRFARWTAAGATWAPWLGGLEARDTGLAAATGGLASARVARRAGEARSEWRAHDGELLLAHVLAGAVTLHLDGRADERLADGDAAAVPAGLRHAWGGATPDLELLVVEVAGLAAPRGSEPE